VIYSVSVASPRRTWLSFLPVTLVVIGTAVALVIVYYVLIVPLVNR
jgi:hypothetical protein